MDNSEDIETMKASMKLALSSMIAVQFPARTKVHRMETSGTDGGDTVALVSVVEPKSGTLLVGIHSAVEDGT